MLKVLSIYFTGRKGLIKVIKFFKRRERINFLQGREGLKYSPYIFFKGRERGLKLIICFAVEERVNIIIIFSGGKGLKLTSFSSIGGKCYRD